MWARVPSTSFNVLQFLQFPKIHRKRKLMLVRLSWGSSYSNYCLMPCADSNLRPYTAVVIRHHPSKMRALRSPDSDDPSIPLIWSWTCHKSLPSTPTAPICYKSILPSVLVSQGGPGTPSNDLSSVHFLPKPYSRSRITCNFAYECNYTENCPQFWWQ
jgi:hypothetical protein